MCGIFGYVGNNPNAANITLKGLKLLEYRGYDSWGIAIKAPLVRSQIRHHEMASTPGMKNQRSKIIVEKHVGKIGNSQLNSQFSDLNSQLAIGHTRWATHGGVTVKNAHPHLDCSKSIAIVHNGIVENYLEIKAELVKKNHKFVSETDSEVIAHLIEEFLKTKGFATSVRDAFNRLTGMNAVVVMNVISKEIIAAKNGSPLVIGVGKDEFFIASDAVGIAEYTKNVVFLEDNQMAILGKNLQILSLPKGQELTFKTQKLDWSFEIADKGAYDHFLLKEINDQEQSIRDAITQNEKDLFHLANLIKTSYGTYLIGCGTAAHACRMATYIFSIIAKRHVNFAIGSEFAYYEDFLTPKSLLIAASQSGETVDLIDAINAARRHKSKVASLVNVVGSTLYRSSDIALPLRAGAEKAVLSTKAFTSKLAIFYLLAFVLAGKYNEGRKILLNAAREVKNLLQDKTFSLRIKKLAKKIYKSYDIYILGRGLSFPLALEAAHKIKEASYIHAEGFAGGEPKHCEISLVSKGTPTIIFAPNDETKSAILSNAMEFKARGAYIIGIAPERHSVFDEWIKVPDLGVVSSLINIIPAQLLAYHLALYKGNDPDKPRNLAKSVTVK